MKEKSEESESFLRRFLLPGPDVDWERPVVPGQAERMASFSTLNTPEELQRVASHEHGMTLIPINRAR